MTNLERLQEFTQQVYLTIYGRRLTDLTNTSGLDQIEKTKIWCNLFLDELEKERDTEGKPINWKYLRENDAEIGTISTATDTFDLPDGALRLVADEERPLIIMQDSSIVSVWDVVDPSQITKRSSYGLPRDDRVTYTNEKIVFSRALTENEVGGTINADVMFSFPRLADNDTTLFDLPIPRQLLVLGAAKNATLPDIVQGGLSPSYTQKYGDLLDGEKMENAATSVGNEAVTDDYSSIGGVY